VDKPEGNYSDTERDLDEGEWGAGSEASQDDSGRRLHQDGVEPAVLDLVAEPLDVRLDEGGPETADCLEGPE
jgi:hypothetical protein